MARIDIVTIFPRMIEAMREEGVLARGIRKGLLALNVWDLRDFANDRHRSTDDEAYGGGPGMVMLAEPVFRCVEAIRAQEPDRAPFVVMTSPQGTRFDQAVAQRLARQEWVIFLCGRYEGFDERVAAIVDEEISLGDFVVSGGELPAMVMTDAIGRLIEGVVGNADSVAGDSFYDGLLDHPHYTRPVELRGQRVPAVLVSGHAERIRRWRRKQALQRTLARRPDLLEGVELDEEAKKLLREGENEKDGEPV